MCIFKISLELGINGGILVMRRSFGSYKEIKLKEIPMSGSAGMRARSLNPLKVLGYRVF